MESAVKREPVPLGWKLGIFLPLVAAGILLLVAHGQSDLHRQILLSTLGALSVMLSAMVQSIFWLVARKMMLMGIVGLIVSSAVLGFGVHTLLRTIGG